MILQTIDARLANDTTKVRSLFTGTFTDITSIKLTLSPIAQGTANFAIYVNGTEQTSKDVTKGEDLSWSPAATDIVQFYMNSYNADDLAQAFVLVS